MPRSAPGSGADLFPEACHEETGRAKRVSNLHDSHSAPPERTPFNYADLTDYREGQITSLALIRSKEST